MGEPKLESEPVPTPQEGRSPQATFLDGMATAARRILSENPDIAQRMLEHLRMQPLVSLQPEDLVSLPKLVEDQPQVVEVQSQEAAEASPSTLSTPQRLRKLPKGKFLLTPKKGAGFFLGIAHETLLVQIRWEGTSSEPTQVEDQPAEVGAESERGPGHEDPVTPFLIGAKTKPMTRFASKQGPSTKTPAFTKRPTKTLGKWSSSKRPKR